MVDEGRTVNPSHGIYAEHDIDTVRFQQLPKLFPCIVRAHGVFDCLPQPVECPVLLQRALRPLIILLKGLIADIFSDTARFERRADTVAIVGHGTVNHSGIVPSVDGSRTFLDRNIEQLQQGAEFSIRRAFVISQTRPGDGRNLLLDIPLGIIHLPQALPVRQSLSLDARMQTVFPLQVTQNLHRAPGLEIVREFAALLIDTQ